MATRRNITKQVARQGAFQVLFALQSNPDADLDDLIDQVVSELTEEVDQEYLHTIVNGVLEQQAELDPVIAQYLSEHWSLGRLTKTDLLILRIAVYEMKFQTNVPNRVALNEALELAKLFSDDKSRRFINGVLSNLI
ncbi:transcription antitermination factor NusB [Ligilactobacillus salitolerans]|uniref:Transcription antitermination protein NusB n=1 Tax=Ligilactobacillus salitolerans TaxID=1808352 RepID=A0A401IU84_9LACO|nr:transcription antitermination factor NusB [Ligilactobacillus salitolerans]GBG95068.1 transcription antitermination factor NusB [Ligilactobacillus salitolerans]